MVGTSSEAHRRRRLSLHPLQTKSLSSQLEETRAVATSTRRVYEGTVEQRAHWRRAVQEKENAKSEAVERYELFRAYAAVSIVVTRCDVDRRRFIVELYLIFNVDQVIQDSTCHLPSLLKHTVLLCFESAP